MEKASKISGITVIIVFILLSIKVIFSSSFSLLGSLFKLELPNLFDVIFAVLWVLMIFNFREIDMFLFKQLRKFIK